jgi:hypothetical protein
MKTAAFWDIGLQSRLSSPDVSEMRTAVITRVTRRYSTSRLRGTMTQKADIFTLAAVRTLNLTRGYHTPLVQPYHRRHF